MESNAMKLYELGAELEAVIERIIENDGDIDEETEQLLDALSLEFEEKAERVVMAIRAHKARAGMVQMEIERLEALRNPHVNAAANLKAYLATQMTRANVRKIDRPLGKAYFAKNSQPSISAPLPEDLPRQYQRITVEADKKALAEVYKNGQILPPGVTGTWGSHLRIK